MDSPERTSGGLRDRHPAEGAEKAYIAVARPRARPSRALKQNDTFAVIDSHGDINVASEGADGLYVCDTRHLSYLQFTVLGFEPLLLGSSLPIDSTYLNANLTNPDIFRDGRVAVRKDQIHFARTVFVSDGGLYQKLSVVNYEDEAIGVLLALGFDADFADLFEVRGMRRASRGTTRHEVDGRGAVRFTYDGLDGVARTTRIAFDPVPDVLEATVASYRFVLPPRERLHFFVDVECNAARARRAPADFMPALLGTRRDRRRRMRGQATVVTDNGRVNEVLRRSAADLAMLLTETPAGPYPYAGLPWFSAVFGRDGLITALEMLWLKPQLAEGVLRYLAANQATATLPAADAEPGKILHEAREGEMAALGEVPFGRYYGSVDATPLFVLLAGHHAERTGDDALLAELWGNIEAALAWMDGPGDADGDGFIEYARQSEKGLANQGWKDSSDSVFHADGSLAEGPIALVEVQAYAYEARVLAARAARRLGKPQRARQLEAAAGRLREKFEAEFWSGSLGSYVLALDGDKRRCEVLSSNAGQVLRSGIACRSRASRVADLLLGPAFQSGWGIRTIADSAPRYNPMSYHNGSIWPHDNALIVSGLPLCGRGEGVERITRALFEAAAAMDHRRLPELFCGFQRRGARTPVLYPVACSPQAWSSGAVFFLLQSLLGIEIDGHARVLRFRGAMVPQWLGRVEVRNLTVGSASVDVRLRRAAGGAAIVEPIANDDDVTIELC